MAKNFRQRYCEHFGCPEGEYTRDLFWRVVYHPWAARLILLFKRNFYRADRALIRDVGEVDDIIDFYRKTRNFFLDLEKRNSYVRMKLKLRVSVYRLNNLYKNIME